MVQLLADAGCEDGILLQVSTINPPPLPCYGNIVERSREGTNHWRILKDPVGLHPRQLEELNRLVRERVAPATIPSVRVDGTQLPKFLRMERSTPHVQ